VAQASSKGRVVRHSKSLIALALAACYGGQAAAESAAELLAEGNQLVRSGIYRTALLRYREAAAAGLDSGLLHYNLGVVHYELEDYTAAADEFARAAADPALAALASLNRGLALEAAGNAAAASDAFRAAADAADDRRLRRAAENAAANSVAANAPPASRSRTFESIAEPTARIGRLELSAAARVGQDDNVYRTPADAYVDLSDPTQPLVTPVVQSASFMPAELHALYALDNESGDTQFKFRYDMDGAFYDAAFSDANVVDQSVSMGADIVLGDRQGRRECRECRTPFAAERRRRRAVDTAFFVGTHRETNFDPDDGLPRDIVVQVNGQPAVEDLSERFSYKAAGVNGELAHTLGRVTWRLNLKFERDEYERTEAVANFDHDFFYGGVDLDYDVSDAMMLRFGLRKYRTVYDERPARDLTGALLDTNPPQEYDHIGLQVGVARRLGRSVHLEADYLWLDRTDGFVGYYDYTLDVLRVAFGFHPAPRFAIKLAAIGRSYDYPNAFAYHVAAGGARELEQAGLTLEAEYRLKPHFTLWAELDSLDVTSTDARAAYLRTQAMLGVEWRK
jgi:Tfp pilus assembly protein PilF